MSPLLGGSTAATGRPLVALSDPQRRITYQAAALLLGYPDADLLSRLPVVRRGVAELPAGVADPLLRLTDYLAAGAPTALATQYVGTFDLQRRCCLYLTYYAHGDTRKRGMALLAFSHAYRAAGLELAADELPDHLAVVLEFAATGDLAVADRLLSGHRAGLELLLLALREAGSPYADAVGPVSATLPALRGTDREAVLALAREGPPAEEVGLDPYSQPFEPPTVPTGRR